MTYAQGTQVPAERTKAEIERILMRRYNADQILTGWEAGRAVIAFAYKGIRVRIVLPLPLQDDPRFRRTATGQHRTDDQVIKAWKKETRRIWRTLVLMLKAKLELIDSGITGFAEEFLPHLLLPDGRTVGEAMLLELDQIIQTGKLPLLPE